MTKPLPDFALQTRPTLRFRWVDLVVCGAILLILWVVASLGRGMVVPFDEAHRPQISLAIRSVPYYAARSTLRMFIAYACSLVFTIVVGYAAAKSLRARAIILPALDILQSVPVLGFLSVTVTGFMALFPRSLLGVECASIFAIFTGQVWNMAFGFYHSLITIPPEMQEAASVYQLNRWERFTKVELPSTAIGLIWNSMMSFGGGWFFVAQSEAISVLNQDLRLPGLGSYMFVAVEQGQMKAALVAILAMIVVIVAIDQLLWRPVVAWAEKFKVEQVEATSVQTSPVLDFLRKTHFVRVAFSALYAGLHRILDGSARRLATASRRAREATPNWDALWRALGAIAFWTAITGLLYYSVRVAREMRSGMTLREFGHVFYLGLLTLLRVAVMTAIATLIWTPIGVWIGFRPRVAKVAQPIAQIAASFPVNMTFPFVVGFFIAAHIPINFGSILLIGLGTQWYLLFNVIAGAIAIPSDMKESARVFGLRGWPLWKRVILPAVFPYWVTGACTAAGGAWNASIVAEAASWGKQKLIADGLGSYIAQVTDQGDWPAIFCSIAVMSLFVVSINRLLWRRLYALAEAKYHLD